MRIPSALATALLASTLTGCGGFSTTCGDFQKADSDKRTELAQGWLDNNSDAVKGSILFSMKSESEKEQYIVDSLQQYCSDHPDGDLSNLTPGIAFGS